MASIDFLQFDTELGISYSHYASEALKKDMWIVKKEFNFWLDDARTKRVNVPKGYLTDGASVPRPFWSLIPPWGEYGQAAVMHDWLCEYLNVWNGKMWVRISRTECDQLFNQGMKALKVKDLTRKVMFGAVNAYSHLASITNQSFDPNKRRIEEELLQHFQLTGEWI